MSTADQTQKSARGRKPRKSTADQIKEAETHLKNLKAQLQKEERQERERNQKEVQDLFKEEGLEDVPAAVWASAMQAIKEALKKQNVQKPKGAQEAKKEDASAGTNAHSDPKDSAAGTIA